MVTTNVTGTRSAYLQALGLQPDGRIVACGNAVIEGEGLAYAVVRYLPDGSLDTQFGRDGCTTVNFPGESELVSTMLIRPDGTIVTVGRIKGETGIDVAVLQYKPDGSPDESFGENGHLVLDFEGISASPDLMALQGGKLIIQVLCATGSKLVRVHEDGSMEHPFCGNADGRAPADFQIVGFAIAPDGSIVAADPYTHRLAVYSADGALLNFYDAGVSPAPPLSASQPVFRDMIRDADGKLVFCGDVKDGDEDSQWVVMRMLGPP